MKIGLADSMRKIRRALEWLFIFFVYIFGLIQTMFLWMAFTISTEKQLLIHGWFEYLEKMKNAIREER